MGRKSSSFKTSKFGKKKSQTQNTSNSYSTMPQKQSSNQNLPNSTRPNSMGQTLKEGATLGLGMGLGSAVAHSAFDSLTRSDDKNEKPINNEFNKCIEFLNNYKDCISNTYNQESCNIHLNNLDNCMKTNQ